MIKSDVLRDLVPTVQFEKREKHPWRSVTFSKVVKLQAKPATLLKVTPLHGCFHVFKIVQIVPNCATHLIFRYRILVLLHHNYLLLFCNVCNRRTLHFVWKQLR